MVLSDVQPLTAPAKAPVRYRIGRLAEASDFRSWAEVADLMLPLYRAAAIIPATSPLRAEVENIRTATTDPKERAAKALEIAQGRVRYVALLMGQGGYVPASAETTWSRRYGDCKAKTALLLAMLHALDIEADAVMVNSNMGDAIADRLPMLGHFNHVLVRARIAGRDYWLDGTRTGDAGIDEIPVPNFGWGLPITAAAKLVKVVPAPLARPATEVVIDMDASEGVRAPVPARIDILVRGDAARELNQVFTSITPAKLDEAMRQRWKKDYDFVSIAESTYKFDKSKGELRQTVKGTVKMDWRDGWFAIPAASLGYDPDFQRASGPQQDAPFSTAYPHYDISRVTIRLPAGFAAEQKRQPSVKQSLVGVDYQRSVAFAEDVMTVETSERATVPEVSHTDALAAEKRLRTLWRDDLHLRLPDNYKVTAKDLEALASEEPSSASAYLDRGILYLNSAKYDEAIADFSRANQLDPEDAWILANRAITYAWKREFELAQKDIAAADALDPKNPLLIKGKGLIAEFKGDFPTAAAEFTAALKVQPEDSFALYHRANAYLKLGDINGAEADLNAYDKNNPGGMFTVLGRAEIARLRGDNKAAVDGFTKVLSATPADDYSLTHRSWAFEAMGEDERALSDAALALQTRPLNSDMRMLRARIFNKRGQKNKAAAEADLFLKAFGQHAFAHATAAQIYDLAGMHTRAMAAFERALRIEQKSYIYVLRAYMRPMSDEAGRLSDFAAAVKLDPKSPDFLVSLAKQLTFSGKLTEALGYFDQVLTAEPDRKDIGIERALLLARLGRHSEAEAALAKLRGEMKAAVEFNNLCWAKATAGLMLESALEDCKEALRLAPDSAAYLDNQGMTLLRLKRFDDAIVAYGRALAKRPNEAVSLMGRALAHAGKGDLAQARADVDAARAADFRIDDIIAAYGLKYETPTAVTRN
jgi:tetratricopeptide (TPR) repeat protein